MAGVVLVRVCVGGRLDAHELAQAVVGVAALPQATDERRCAGGGAVWSGQALPALVQQAPQGIELAGLCELRAGALSGQQVQGAAHFAVQLVALQCHQGHLVEQHAVHVARAVAEPVELADALQFADHLNRWKFETA
ncbi:hypothetical protein ASF11_25545 [Acidovorax sp. Leaf76]|nr:hypothetical protein ASF11_25545 [Acidovorax sp. Leaf76]KQS32546.1 hypothetical protein ASG27_25540 [Acidovorax sp. Leaf191]